MRINIVDFVPGVPFMKINIVVFVPGVSFMKTDNVVSGCREFTKREEKGTQGT
jgi:hypothetical protein